MTKSNSTPAQNGVSPAITWRDTLVNLAAVGSTLLGAGCLFAAIVGLPLNDRVVWFACGAAFLSAARRGRP
jgi:hypothetical protein